MWKDMTPRSEDKIQFNTLYPQKARLQITKKSLRITHCEHIWDSLPDQVTCAQNVITFKNRLGWHRQDREMSNNNGPDLSEDCPYNNKTNK